MTNLILALDRVKNKLVREYRKYVFRKLIDCSHTDFSLVGNVTLINRNIKLGHGVTIYPGAVFWGDGLIEIGDNVDIGFNTAIYASKDGGAQIGDNTHVAASCYIIDIDHGTNADILISHQPNSVGKIIIGKDCWLAQDVTVLKGSVIEDGAIIGAKAMVKKRIPSNSIAVGIPASIIKHREK